MARSKRERTKFWTQPAMVPTAAGAQAGKHAKRAKRWRRLVMACTVSFPIMVITLMLVVAQSVVGGAGPAQGDAGDGVPTQVRAEALDAVGDWLASEVSPLTDAQVLGWDHAETVPWPESVDEEDRTHTVWTAHVLVGTSTTVYDAGVQVNYSPSVGATVVGSPSLLPLPMRGASDEISLWPGTASVAASEATTRAVQAWAQAFTSGDSDALATVISDPDASHLYSPLSGFTQVTSQVEAAAYRAYKRGDQPDTSVLMVSVTLYAQREGQERPSRLSFDLLVSDPTTGAARVTAWGSPGSGPGLRHYENAVVIGNDPETTTPSASPTPAPTDSQAPQSTAPAEPTDSAAPSTAAEPAPDTRAPEGLPPTSDEGQ